MKKIILVNLLLISSFLAKSQEGPFVSFNTGVAFAASKDALGVNSVTTSNGDFTNTNIYGSFGNGLQLSLRAGFKMSQNFGGELGISYLNGFKTTINEVSGPNTNGSTTSQSSQIYLKPGVLFETKNSALTLYARSGFVLPIGGKRITEQNSFFTGGGVNSETYTKKEHTGVVSLGFFGGVGVSIKIGDNLKFFTELEGLNMRIKQKTSSMVEFRIDGDDELNGVDINQKETIYVDEVSSSDNRDNTQPSKERANYDNFSSFGFNVGVRFNF